MSQPTDRDEFKAWCLRTLGDGVIQINVSDEQLEDRIDEGLYVYQQFHMDGVVKAYLPHQITASYANLTGYVPNGNGATTFSNGEFITGNTSYAIGTVLDAVTTPSNVGFYTTRSIKSDANLEQIYTGFIVGEVVTGVSSGVKATVSAIVVGDFDNGWIPVVPAVIAVTKIFAPFDSRMSADILFDPQAQFNMSLLSNFTSNSIIPYFVGRQYQQLLNDLFRGRPPIRFQRHMGRLYIDVNMYTTFRPGNFVVIECFRCIDPDTYPLVWGDEWLQRYCIALIKRQWGTNLSKYTGITLPGSVTLDGKTMLTEAVQEVKDLKDELKHAYQLPCDFMVG